MSHHPSMGRRYLCFAFHACSPRSTARTPASIRRCYGLRRTSFFTVTTWHALDTMSLDLTSSAGWLLDRWSEPDWTIGSMLPVGHICVCADHENDLVRVQRTSVLHFCIWIAAKRFMLLVMIQAAVMRTAGPQLRLTMLEIG